MTKVGENEGVIYNFHIDIDGIILSENNKKAVNLAITDKDTGNIINVPLPIDMAFDIATELNIVGIRMKGAKDESRSTVEEV